jgi:hypothetical protein
MKEKLIIENRTNLPMIKVLDYVNSVIKLGRISNGQYCYVTTFDNDYVVSAFKNKGSDRLVIYKEKEYKEDKNQ